MSKLVLRLAAVAVLGIGASACSSVPDWVDPTTWLDDSSSDQTADNGQSAPDVADIPAKPQASTPDDQKQVADSLAADRKQANYSADQLQAGNEASVAPPPADTAPDTATASTTTSSASTEADNDTPAGALPPTEPRTQVASAEPPPPVQTTVSSSTMSSVNTTAVPQIQNGPMSDSALGFKQSAAPSLAADVTRFTPSGVVNHFKQTASLNSDSSAVPATTSKSGHHRRHRSQAAEGGPEAMSGDVVANMDAIDSAPQAPASTYSDTNGNPPAAVVFFAGDGTTLNASSREKVKEAVADFKSKGGTGFIKVVGHASSRTSNMPLEAHLELIFRKSQERANAVAHEIIREGIPADKVLVNAVGDSQPVYYESMPKGEEGNRRAEIFFQS
jgi:outer membrane protein OmpA-like peptidoglycan-associated protein